MSHHRPELDGLRGVAILLVLCVHFIKAPAQASTATIWAERIAEVGWSGVSLFFVLSGYLITSILLRAKGKSYYYRDFFVRRSLRIFPL